MAPTARHRLIAFVVLVLAGLPAFLVGGRYWVGTVGVDEARARFRAAGAAGAAAASPPPAGLPAPGVYRYRTTGGERISFLDYHRNYPAVTVRLITRRGCGVREEQLFLVQHIEYYDRCGSELPAYGTDIAYWWTHGTQDFRCGAGGSFDGAGMAPGQTSTWRCADEDTRAEQTTTYLDDSDVVVGGTGPTIRARHTRWVTSFSGATKGTATVEDWFDPATGLVLREKRSIGLKVGSPFVGDVNYIDVSSYELLSTTPLR